MFSDGLQSPHCEPSSTIMTEMPHFVKSNDRVRVTRVYPVGEILLNYWKFCKNWQFYIIGIAERLMRACCAELWGEWSIIHNFHSLPQNHIETVLWTPLEKALHRSLKWSASPARAVSQDRSGMRTMIWMECNDGTQSECQDSGVATRAAVSKPLESVVHSSTLKLLNASTATKKLEIIGANISQ